VRSISYLAFKVAYKNTQGSGPNQNRTIGPNDSHLVKIPVYKYTGDTPSAAYRFDYFQSIMAETFQRIAAKFSGSDNARYLERLTVSPITAANPPNRNDIKSLWQSESALEVMNGLIEERPDGYWVTSKIFIGDLGHVGSYFGSEEVTVHLRVSGEEYNSIVDSHSLVTLFALAMDAMRLRMPPNYTISLLAEAENVFSKLRAGNSVPVVRSGRGRIDRAPIELDVQRMHDAVMRASADAGRP
jgi:hypothetical protein